MVGCRFDSIVILPIMRSLPESSAGDGEAIDLFEGVEVDPPPPPPPTPESSGGREGEGTLVRGGGIEGGGALAGGNDGGGNEGGKEGAG